MDHDLPDHVNQLFEYRFLFYLALAIITFESAVQVRPLKWPYFHIVQATQKLSLILWSGNSICRFVLPVAVCSPSSISSGRHSVYDLFLFYKCCQCLSDRLLVFICLFSGLLNPRERNVSVPLHYFSLSLPFSHSLLSNEKSHFTLSVRCCAMPDPAQSVPLVSVWVALVNGSGDRHHSCWLLL